MLTREQWDAMSDQEKWDWALNASAELEAHDEAIDAPKPESPRINVSVNVTPELEARMRTLIDERINAYFAESGIIEPPIDLTDTGAYSAWNAANGYPDDGDQGIMKQP